MSLSLCRWITLTVALVAQADAGEWKKHLDDGLDALKRGRYAEASRELRMASLTVQSLAKDDPRVGEVRLAQARLRYKEGRWAEADRLCQQAQAAFTKAHGDQHPAVARCLNLRADIYGALGSAKMAVEFAKKAYAIREKKLGKDHVETAESVDTLTVYGGRYGQFVDENAKATISWDVEKGSLHVREKLLGKHHPDLAASLLALAGRHRRDSAKDYLDRAASLLKDAYGEEHPDVAVCLTRLAREYLRQEKLKEAQETLDRAFAIWKAQGGSFSQNPWSAAGIYTMALIRLQRNQRDQAERLFQEAVSRQFATLCDQELCEYFGLVPFSRWSPWYTENNDLGHAEAYLSEMLCRGGRGFTKFLSKKHQELLAKRQKEIKGSGQESHGSLEVLTALRRLQKISDPVTIEVQGVYYRETVFPYLPEFEVSLKNVDEGDKAVGFTAGGDYRSGRSARWRVDVHDSAGKPVRLKPTASEIGGGLFSIGILKPGKTWAATRQPSRQDR